MKISNLIKLIESKTGKKILFKKTLKESLGTNTSKFIKDCLEGDLSVTKAQLLIIINEFFSGFETAAEFSSFERKQKTSKTVLNSLAKIISKETEINIAKVSKTLDLIIGNIEDVAEFKKIYIEVEKGLLGDYIMDSVPQSQLKGYVAQNATIDLGKEKKNNFNEINEEDFLKLESEEDIIIYLKNFDLGEVLSTLSSYEGRNCFDHLSDISEDRFGGGGLEKWINYNDAYKTNSLKGWPVAELFNTIVYNFKGSGVFGYEANSLYEKYYDELKKDFEFHGSSGWEGYNFDK